MTAKQDCHSRIELVNESQLGEVQMKLPYDPQLSSCHPEKNVGIFYRVYFIGYPSNKFLGYRLNIQMCNQIQGTVFYAKK